MSNPGPPAATATGSGLANARGQEESMPDGVNCAAVLAGPRRQDEEYSRGAGLVPPLPLPKDGVPTSDKRPKERSKRRVPLTKAQKRRLCEISRDFPSLSHKQVGQVFLEEARILVERSTVSRAIAKSDEYLGRPLRSPAAKRRWTARFPIVEEATFELIRHCAASAHLRRTLTDDRLTEFAKTAARIVGATNFKASPAWLDGMKRRSFLKGVSAGGELIQSRHIRSEDVLSGGRPDDTATVAKATVLPLSEGPESLYDIWQTAMPHGMGVLEEIDRLEDVYNLHATELFYDVGPEDVEWGVHADTQKSPADMHGNGRPLPDISSLLNPHFGNCEEPYVPNGNGLIEKHKRVSCATHDVGACDRRSCDIFCRDRMLSSGGVGSGNDYGAERNDSGNIEQASSRSYPIPLGGDAAKDVDFVSPSVRALDDALGFGSSMRPTVEEVRVDWSDAGIEEPRNGIETLLGAAGISILPQPAIGTSANTRGSVGASASCFLRGSEEPVGMVDAGALDMGSKFPQGEPLQDTPVSVALASGISLAQHEQGLGEVSGVRNEEQPMDLGGTYASRLARRKTATVLLCVNATGKERLMPWIIGAKGISGPRDHDYRPFPGIQARYVAKEKPWLTSKIVREWLQWFDSTIFEPKRLVMVVTSLINCADARALALKHVVVVPVPMSKVSSYSCDGLASESRNSPPSTGDILLKLFRTQYRLLYLESIMDCIRTGVYIPNVSMRRVAEIVCKAWEQLSSNAVKSAFRISTVLPATMKARICVRRSKTIDNAWETSLKLLDRGLTAMLADYRRLVPSYRYASELGLGGPNMPLEDADSERWVSLPGEDGSVLHPGAPDADIVASVLEVKGDGVESGLGFVSGSGRMEPGKRATDVLDSEDIGMTVDGVDINSPNDALKLVKKVQEFCRRPECTALRNEEVDYNIESIILALKDYIGTRTESRIDADALNPEGSAGQGS